VRGRGSWGSTSLLVDGFKNASDSSVTGGSGTPSAQNSIAGLWWTPLVLWKTKIRFYPQLLHRLNQYVEVVA